MNEKLKNFIIYKQYATDEEIEKAGCFPYFIIGIILLIILYFKKQ